ncbi:unnamed protein product [Peniophora sp. CBMAI 1063]|nr:unnamed protein product [Peniophora sp. CBMAI 1063]
MASARRASLLNKLFDSIVRGEQTITLDNSGHYLEALCTRDARNIFDTLIATPKTLDALQAAMHAELGSDRLNGHNARVLILLQDPALATIGGGKLLQTILLKVATPQYLLFAYRAALLGGELNGEGEKAFSGLLCQLVSYRDTGANYHPLVAETVDTLLASTSPAVRANAQKLQSLLSPALTLSPVLSSVVSGPGGRHDNDPVNYREVDILPTPDELACKKPPYLLPSLALEDVPNDSRAQAHIENQFRLLREDIKYELVEELENLSKKRTPRGFAVEGLHLVGVFGITTDNRGNESCAKWGLKFECSEDLPFFKSAKPKRRKAHLINDKRLMRHQSLTCLILDGAAVAFPILHRDEDLLSKTKPIICLQFDGEIATVHALTMLKSAKSVKVVQLDTAILAHEPVLKSLQAMRPPALAPELFLWDDDPLQPPPKTANDLVAQLEMDPQLDIGAALGLDKTITLDSAQTASLLTALKQRVSLIQGPPGCGKGFIGALIAKIMHDRTDARILIACYTNHALDQLLEDLLDNNVPADSMVRLDGKTTTRTAHIPLFNRTRVSALSRNNFDSADALHKKLSTLDSDVQDEFARYQAGASDDDLLTHIEFDINLKDYAEAFRVPAPDDDTDGVFKISGRGRALHKCYLLRRWRSGKNAGVFQRHPRFNTGSAARVWRMRVNERREHLQIWQEDTLRDQVKELYDRGKRYNDMQTVLNRISCERDINVLKSKRIIACTTTAAAKYADMLHEVTPDVLLVEEAGEILESHVLALLGSETQHMILIGDHQQLRPKVNSHELTVEKDAGFELNVSLFERLILSGYPHQSLKKQHRMRPEISEMIRHLTYPDLVDAEKTHGRPDLRGFDDNVVFLTHSHLEDDLGDIADAPDGGSKLLKQNTFEVQMVLKLIKFLVQQGYGTKNIAVLTPYLGQLSKLKSALQAEVDPYLSEMNLHDLSRAGMASSANAKHKKKPLRLSTIDNYQGEEADVVIITLTRSNAANDIGFMFSPERLNVLLSRARDACIMIGNAETFCNSPKGGELWTKFINFIRDRGHFYEGLPFRCPRHPDRTAILRKPDDFEEHCPDGGCASPCDVILSCGQHKCPSHCHNVSDHSGMRCEMVLDWTCAKGHKHRYQCPAGPPVTCAECGKEAEQEAQRLKEYELRAKREGEQKEHERQMGELAKLEAELLKQQELELAQQRRQAIDDLRGELENARKRTVQSQTDIGQSAASSTSVDAPATPTTISSDASASPTTASGASSPSPVSYALDNVDTTSADAPSTHDTGSVSDSQAEVWDMMGAGSPPSSPSPAGHASPAAIVAPTSPTIPANIPSTASTSVLPSVSPVSPTQPDSTGLSQPLPPSPSRLKWEKQKEMDGASNRHIDDLMAMTGLETVKEQVLTIRDRIELAKRQDMSMSDERFNISLLGNPGTGKTTVARLYAKFLSSVDLIPGDAFVETTGSRLSNEGIDGAKKHINYILSDDGGAIFIDEAYQLVSSKNSSGSQVLDYLLAEMENNVGKIVFILAGYNKEMEAFFEHNPGIPSRVPYTLTFVDYTDHELMHMFEGYVAKKYRGRMQIQGGSRGLYTRIAIRRLARGRGRPGFGNARAMQNMFSAIAERQAIRIERERTPDNPVDEMLFTMEDMIGSNPSTAVTRSEAWKKLNKMIGLASVKQSVQELVDTIGENYHRELLEKKPLQFNLNRVFLGSPGTGKTTVAKLYGQVLADIGMLSNGEVLMKNPSDLKGQYVGQSEAHTKAVLRNAVGKVLVIDEAYMLYKGSGGKDGLSHGDSFTTSVIDTIVAEVQGDPGDDRCVLMLGYEREMLEMFNNVNPGLARRFRIEEAFRFKDFDDTELLQMLNMKLKEQDLDATDDAKRVAIDSLGRERNRPNFSNGGAVENLLGAAKARYQARQAQLSPLERTYNVVFQPADFDPEFDRVAKSAANLVKVFEDLVDSNEVVAKLEHYQKVARYMRATGRKPREARDFIPTTFVFKGPPGTGKTTTARKMGQVYFDMGMLSSPDVVECSASDLVGQFTGHTGPKVRQQCEKALGKVLFIDEAYRLGQGRFAKEAVDELVTVLTQDAFQGKFIVILAGYDKEMDQLMTVNIGLASRFQEEILFAHFSPDRCLRILAQEIKKAQVRSPELEQPSSPEAQALVEVFESLCRLSNWGNARDVITLANKMVRVTIHEADPDDMSGPLTLRWSDALSCAQTMLKEKRDRLLSQSKDFGEVDDDLPEMSADPPPPPPVRTQTASASQDPPPRLPPPASLQWHAATSSPRHPEAQRRGKTAARRERDRVPKQQQEQRKKREAEIQRRLQRMGLCVMGYEWIAESGGYRCAGGTHFVSNAELDI